MSSNPFQAITPLQALGSHELDREGHSSWDAFSVWRDRVQRPARAQPRTSAAVHGWDPHEVWLSRVKRRD